MPNAWTVFMNKCRRRYGDDAWAAPIDGALPTDEVYTAARLRDPFRQLLYFAKPSLQRGLEKYEEEVREADCWQRYAMPTDAYIHAFATTVRMYESIRWVGDLDPCDLASFRALQCGSPTLVQKRGWKLPIGFAGVDSNWMDLAERRIGSRLMACTIKMDRLEREQYRALRNTWPDLATIVGERAAELLDGGRKLEVEGAAGMSLHDPDYRTELLNLIFGGNRERRAMLRAIRGGTEAEALHAAAMFRPDSCEQMVLWRFLSEGSDAPTHAQVAALQALSKGDPPPEPIMFIGLVRDDDRPLVVNAKAAEFALSVLSNVGRRQKEFRHATESLTWALRQEAPQTRFFATFVLGALRVKSSLPQLRELARTDRRQVDGWWSVAAQARDAIAHIETGAWPESRRRREILAESRRKETTLNGAKR